MQVVVLMFSTGCVHNGHKCICNNICYRITFVSHYCTLCKLLIATLSPWKLLIATLGPWTIGVSHGFDSIYIGIEHSL